MLSEFWTRETKEGLPEPVKNRKVLLLLGLIAVLGLALMLWPQRPAAENRNVPVNGTAAVQGGMIPTETELASALQSIEGAGQVQVKLSLASDGRQTYALNDRKQDRSTVEKDKKGMQRTVSEAQDEQNLAMAGGEPVLLEKQAPAVTGVLVIAEGADSPAVTERLVQAVTGLMGVNSAKVKVLPMTEGGR
ncbi:MAG: hypothetical protein ACM3QZ_06185 [Solirubrobacterales bacterium]